MGKGKPTDALRAERSQNFSPLTLEWNKPSVVNVEGESLVYSARGLIVQPDPKHPFEPLDSFIRLEGTESKEIAGFARKWGVLGICEHGLPSTHQSPHFFNVDGPFIQLLTGVGYRHCFPSERAGGMWHEPINAWHTWSGYA